MKRILTFILLLCNLSCHKNDGPVDEVLQESKILLIGNSFFKPYAQHLDHLVEEAGIENHDATLIFRGGENGRPINFWNDSNSDEHQQIKNILDQGDVMYFGMTAGHDSENPTEGHRAWIEYALHNNPEVTVFIAIPNIDYPADWDQLVQDFGFNSVQDLYSYFVNDVVHHDIVDELRAEFPSTNIFTIPTGWSAVHLKQMYHDNALLDDIALFGPKPTSIFTDDKGHQGQIVIETGTLVWLNGIYGIEIETFDYDSGFLTDLNAIAQDIIDNHDANYKQ
jgi:hypothetical protein